jgi:hypothetical protein
MPSPARTATNPAGSPTSNAANGHSPKRGVDEILAERRAAAEALQAVADQLHAALLASGVDVTVPPAGQTGSKVRLPLQYFDNADLEGDTPEGWVASACRKHGKRPNAILLMPEATEAGGSAWMAGRVSAYDAKAQTFTASPSGDDGRVLVMGNPVDVRPVPQTVEELKERLATFRLSDYGMAQRMAFDDELDDAMLESEDEDEDEEKTEDGEAEAEEPTSKGPQKVLALLQTYTKTAQEEKDAAQALQVAVVVTHGLLDAEIGDLLDDEALKAGLVAVLGSLAKVWQGLLAKTPVDLGVDASNRRGAEELVKMIRESIDADTFLEGKLKGTFSA